jgi:hypothetical protein
MKLIFDKKILIFISCFMMIFNHFNSTEANTFDLASQDVKLFNNLTYLIVNFFSDDRK